MFQCVNMKISAVINIFINMNIFWKWNFYCKNFVITALRNIVIFVSGGVWPSCPFSVIWLCWWHSACQENHVLGEIHIVLSLRVLSLIFWSSFGSVYTFRTAYFNHTWYRRMAMKPGKQRSKQIYILIFSLEGSFVLRSYTVHELLEPRCFFCLVPLSSVNSSNGCVLCTVKAKTEHKNIQQWKIFVGFHNHSPLLTN